MMTSTSSEPNDSGNSNNDTSVTTILTNPGIIDRLEQDIADYLSPFGFHLERQQQHEQEDGERSGKCRAVLTIPCLPYSYNNSISPREIMMNDGGTPSSTNITSEAAEGCECGPIATPIGTLHLHIHQESLLSTVGPLLRTFLRLSPSHISPRRLRAIIYCDEHYFVLDALQKLAKMNSEQRCRQLNRQEEISARKMAHYIHMLVRNSMGAALCLELVVVLPCYWRRTLSVLQNEEDEGGGNNINAKGATITSGSKVPISVETVQLEMQKNPDACYYPSVQLVEAAAATTTTTTNNDDGEQPRNRSNSDDNDNNPTSIHLDVQTRMCTVRHQPLIFQWLHSLTHCDYPESSTNNEEGVDACKHAGVRTTTDCDDPYSNKEAKEATPLIVACIEKVGNLHRILMLCHDYDKVDPNRCKCNDSGKEDDTAQSIQSSSMISNLIVIIPNANPGDATDEQQPEDKLLHDFEEAVDHFHKVIINPNGDKNELCHRPTFVYENESAEQIPLIVEQRQAQTMQSTSSNYQHSLVGIDLHPDALTLQGDYATTSSTEHTVSPALQLMRDADAIVFGYESSGIPDTVANQLNGWVQIPSRSSINVVAAMSIIQDALFGAGARC